MATFSAICTLKDGRLFYLNPRGNWSIERAQAMQFSTKLAAFRAAQSVWRGPHATVAAIQST